ncbi:MAG: PAS domain S-box protein [Rhodothermia bacterium]|nr:PAS domain S-box protein [Rhodothermia bacterium]
MQFSGFDIAQDLATLYEISLSVGTTLDVQANCSAFVEKLISRKHLDVVSVWIEKQVGDVRRYELLYAEPKIRLTKGVLSDDHILVTRTQESAFWSISSEDPAFQEMITEDIHYPEGAFAVFRLENLGFLKLYDAKRRLPFYTRELNQLAPLVAQFGESVKRTLAHRTLLQEFEDRQRSTQRLKESETRKSAILESALDAIVTIDESARILEFNPAAERTFGYTKNEILGQSLAEELLIPEHREVLRAGIFNYIRTGQGPVLGRHMEMQAVHKNGTSFPVELAITPIENDERYLFTAYLRDITERKRSEAELIRVNDIAEQSIRSKERFLANMSHEMRTPLNAVIGLTHLLEETSLTRQQSRYLEAIQFSAGSLLALINDILDFAKIDAGKIDFEEVPFRLDELFKGLYAMLRFTAERKGLKLHIIPDENLPQSVVGDQVRLRQILLNLIGNAIKFTEKGEVKLKVKAMSVVDGKVTLAFAVEDTGIGIPSEKLSHIFDSFSQAASDTTRKYGGTGLGLAIVKELVSQQGGEIEVISEVNQGTVFNVLLPFLVSDQTVAASAENENTEIDQSLLNVRILVVEDNNMNQFVAHQMLTKWGATVDVAESGLIAIEKVRENTFDLVLMDIQMPGMDGIDATKYIRQTLKRSAAELPIIALTASMLAENRTQVFEAGMNDFVLKPFEPAHLRKVLVLHWKKAQANRQPMQPSPSSVETTLSPQKLVIEPIPETIQWAKAPSFQPDNKSRSMAQAVAQAPVVSNKAPDKEKPVAPLVAPQTLEIEIKPTVPNGDSLPANSVNIQQLLDHSLGNKAFVVRVIDLFLMQTPEQIHELTEFWRRGNFGQVKFIAHKMKSSARMIGIEALAQTLDTLEHDLAEGKTMSPQDGRMQFIVSLVDQALAELKLHRSKLAQ